MLRRDRLRDRLVGRRSHVERREVARRAVRVRGAVVTDRDQLHVRGGPRRVRPHAFAVRDRDLARGRLHESRRGELLRTRRIADALHRFRAVQRRRLGSSLVVRRRRVRDRFRLDEPGEARVLRHERSELARVARGLLDTFAIEPVRRDERDALALHRAHTDTSLGRDHVLMDVRVRVASERVRPSREEDLGLVRRARLHRGVRERAQLLFAAKDATQRTTPTRTLRKRAGAAPWPVCPDWTG